MCDSISIDPEIMGGTPVFKGTRVPISTLFDYLSNISNNNNEDPVAEFLNQFPSVKPQHIAKVLDYYSSKAKQAA
jgi:uncharacterized protein (DUF433 family)